MSLKKMDVDTLVPCKQLKPGMVIVARHHTGMTGGFDPYSYPMAFIDDPGHGALNVDAFTQKRQTQVGYYATKPEQFWVRGMLEERSLTKELRVDDMIAMCHGTAWEFHVVTSAPVPDTNFTIGKTEDDRFYRFEYRTPEGKAHKDGGRRGSLPWKVIIPLGSVSKRASNPLPGAKHIPEFPHKCTRCQQPAYVGLFEVVHQSKNTNCPARGA